MAMTVKEAFAKLLLLKPRWFWYAAAALATVLMAAVVWLLIREQRAEERYQDWTRAFSSPFRIEIADDGLLEAPNADAAHRAGRPEPAQGNLHLKLRLQQTVASRLLGHSGMLMQLVLAGVSERSFSGRLLQVYGSGAEGEEGGGTAFNAVFDVEAAEPLLQPGTAVGSVIVLDTLAQAIALPESAVFEIAGAPVVFPRSGWPAPRPVQLGPRSNGAIVVVGGVSEGEEVSGTPPKEEEEARVVGRETYKKSAHSSREQLAAHLDEMVRRFSAWHEGEPELVSAPGASGGADSAAAIHELLATPAVGTDTGKGVSVQQMRIGPGEGGKLAPVPPETLQQMKPGEKVSISVPTRPDSAADSLAVSRDSVAIKGKPPGRP